MKIEITAAIKAMPEYQEIAATIEANFREAIEARNELGAEGDSYVIQCGPMHCSIDVASKVTAVFSPHKATRYTDRAAALLAARRIRNGAGDRGCVVRLFDAMNEHIVKLRTTLADLTN